MKIKRYTAPSMREALALIRAEQGEDAVILSSRRIETGVEVVSAVDYDAALINAAPAPIPAPAVTSDQPVAAPAGAAAAVPAASRAPPPAPALGRRDPQYDEFKRELKDMRRLLETELAGLGWQDRRQRDPVQAGVLESLSALDIAPDVTRALAARLPRRSNARNPANLPLALLVKYLPTCVDRIGTHGGVLAVVGPTGVGKTTTIAKLAARWCMQHGSQDLALVSTDGYRIGAREQLLTYARILDAPMHVATEGRDLNKVLERLKSKRLVLIDTAGMSQRDLRIPEHLDGLRLGAARAQVLLAVSAAVEAKTLDETMRVYARIKPDACVLTKLDESASFGGAFSAVLRHGLPIAYLCNGQRVPEDLHSAAPKRLWLVRAALRLQAQTRTVNDERFMAQHFGRAQAHASF